MTAPDHTPFLTKDCLRTPLDVADWIAHEGPVTLAKLDARLDRERRQACRRGALVLTRFIARAKLWLRSDYAQNKGAERFGTFAKCMAHQREMRWGSDLRRALAFRAAARAK